MKLNGPGKYDDLASLIREQAKAETVMVIVINGDKGHGFSVQSHNPEMLPVLPKILRDVAEEMERDLKRMREKVGK